MPSAFLDESLVERYRRLDFDFGQRTLAGKVILLAGGTGGLGPASAALLARDGATLVLGYRRDRARAEGVAAAVTQKYGSSVHLVDGDIREAEAREKYIAAAEAAGEFYGLVVLVGDPARADFSTITEREFEASLTANYTAPVLLAKRAGESILARNVAGSIVLFSSMQGLAPFEGSLNYAGPKAALVHAARILARQWGGKPNLRVNVVAPGVTMVGMAEASIRGGKYDRYIQEGIIPRFGRPEDVARVVRLLLEPDNYLTGQVIIVDGGLTVRR